MRRHCGVPALVLTLTAALVMSLSLLPSAAVARQSRSAATAPGLVIRFNAWGPLKLGMTHQQAQHTGMVSTEGGHCAPGYEMAPKFAKRGYVVWTTPQWTVDQIVIRGKREHTQKGIHVGSTLRALRHAYKGLSPVRHAKAAAISRQSAGASDDLYFASVRSKAGVINFQFAYGPRPTSSSRIDLIVIARKTAVYWGC